MEWTVHWQAQTIVVKLPPELTPGQELRAEVGTGQPISFVWEERLRTLIIHSPSSRLERCVKLRSRRLQKFPFEAACELDLEVTGCRSSVIKAKISPLASGEAARQSRPQSSGVVVRSPMTGKVLQVMAVLGAAVENGEPLVIIEAMKMENQIFAPQAGGIKELKVQVGDLVQVGAELLRIENH